MAKAKHAFTALSRPVFVGATWTTDAPFRETREAIDMARKDRNLMVYGAISDPMAMPNYIPPKTRDDPEDRYEPGVFATVASSTRCMVSPPFCTVAG